MASSYAKPLDKCGLRNADISHISAPASLFPVENLLQWCSTCRINMGKTWIVDLVCSTRTDNRHSG